MLSSVTAPITSSVSRVRKLWHGTSPGDGPIGSSRWRHGNESYNGEQSLEPSAASILREDIEI